MSRVRIREGMTLTRITQRSRYKPRMTTNRKAPHSPKPRASGPTQSYENRIASGRRSFTCWLSTAAYDALQASAKAHARTKTELVEAWALSLERSHDPTPLGSPLGSSRREK